PEIYGDGGGAEREGIEDDDLDVFLGFVQPEINGDGGGAESEGAEGLIAAGAPGAWTGTATTAGAGTQMQGHMTLTPDLESTNQEEESDAVTVGVGVGIEAGAEIALGGIVESASAAERRDPEMFAEDVEDDGFDSDEGCIKGAGCHLQNVGQTRVESAIAYVPSTYVSSTQTKKRGKGREDKVPGELPIGRGQGCGGHNNTGRGGRFGRGGGDQRGTRYTGGRDDRGTSDDGEDTDDGELQANNDDYKRTAYTAWDNMGAPPSDVEIGVRKNREDAVNRGHSGVGTDQGMKNSVFDTTWSDMMQMQCCGASGNRHKCPFGGTCTANTTLQEIQDIRTEFWGGFFDRPPTTSERGKQLDGLAQECYSNDATSKTLKRKLDPRSSKSIHAESYVRYLAKILADTCPTDDGVQCIPYDSFSQLFEEYQAFCTATLVNKKSVAGKETFRVVLAALHSVIRLLGSKGTFQTCDICNNANDLLRSKRAHYNREHRDIILKFKRLHLLQQANERQAQEQNRLSAARDYIDGQPVTAYILCDGVEVVCGPVDAVLCYHTDNLVAGGANFMVEVMRHILIDLSKLLARHDLRLPRTLHLQLDNCGENKNKEMMAFLSILIEAIYFDDIYVNFLIVGHTHTTIDQYFGVLSKTISPSKFIGSPLALQELIQNCHGTASRRPLVNRQIYIVHDYKTAFAPYLNKLKYYQVPHVFHFHRVLGKAVMKYMLFSFHTIWLPREPEVLAKSIPELMVDIVSRINLREFMLFEGRDELYRQLGLEKRTNYDQLGNRAATEHEKAIGNLHPLFVQIERDAIVQQELRFEDEALLGTANSRPRYRSPVAELRKVETLMAQPNTVITRDLLGVANDGNDEYTVLVERTIYDDAGLEDDDFDDFVDEDAAGLLCGGTSFVASADVNASLKTHAMSIVTAARNVFKNLKQKRFFMTQSP
ncbi:hypothetical protein B484DRAFT_435569, partial [Ochromonadaceae sp. CCMP2298]